MKVYICRVEEMWGGVDVLEVVVAETTGMALGFCLEAHPASDAVWWDITELDTTKIGRISHSWEA